jgi:hypothetical protein
MLVFGPIACYQHLTRISQYTNLSREYLQPQHRSLVSLRIFYPNSICECETANGLVSAVARLPFFNASTSKVRRLQHVVSCGMKISYLQVARRQTDTMKPNVQVGKDLTSQPLFFSLFVQLNSTTVCFQMFLLCFCCVTTIRDSKQRIPQRPLLIFHTSRQMQLDCFQSYLFDLSRFIKP